MLALLGSGEYLPVAEPIDRFVLSQIQTQGDTPRVICLPTAAAPDGPQVVRRWLEMGAAHFQRLGVAVRGLEVTTRAEADDPALAAEVAAADYVYFSGGKPGYLLDVLQGSRLWQAVLAVLERGGGLGGCSAGAMVLAQSLPDLRLAHFPRRPALGLVAADFILPHCDALPRWRGLSAALIQRMTAPGQAAWCIDEETALVGRRGGPWQVLGRGRVHRYTRQAVRTFSAGEIIESLSEQDVP